MTNAIAQLLDSIVFFVIAFAGVVPFSSVWEVLLVGFVLKVVFMMLAAPILYLNRVEVEEGEGHAAIAIR